MSSLGGGSSRERMSSAGGSPRDKSDRDQHSRDRERTVDDTTAAAAAATTTAGGRERSGSGSLEKVDHHREHRERDRHASDSRGETTIGNIASTGISRSESPNDEATGGGGGHHGQSSHHREREPSTSRIERERERVEKRERERGEREPSVSGREKKMKKEKKPRKKRKQASIERSGSGNDISQPSHHSGANSDKKYDHQVVEGVEGGQYSHRDRKEKKGKKRKEAKLAKEKAKAEAAALAAAASTSEKDDYATSSRRNSSSHDHDNQSNSGTAPSSHQSDRGHTKKSKKNKGQAAQDQGLSSGGYSAAQKEVNDMMRRALEEDQYSALGSVVDTDSSDSEDEGRIIVISTVGSSKSGRGHSSGGNATTTSIRLDRNVIVNAMRKRLRIEGMKGSNVIDSKTGRNRDLDGPGGVSGNVAGNGRLPGQSSISGGKGDDGDIAVGGRKKKKKKGKRGANVIKQEVDMVPSDHEMEETVENHEMETVEDNDIDAADDDGSIFGQGNSSNNSTWVECDKCKKWRRLRGVVDAKKLLPLKWYCHMNKNDPERAKCTAPEEEYDAPSTPESATDHRARKHLRLWVRRLQCNEAYEARLPTMTRGKKRSATASKEPYEWVRCCNPSCGKWRAILRFMDASTVVDNAKNGEWYCVQNTWDEKIASCAAPQENLPAIGCPPWVMQDDEM